MGGDHKAAGDSNRKRLVGSVESPQYRLSAAPFYKGAFWQ